MRRANHEVSNDEQHDDETRGMHLPSPSSLDKLPYLSAILKESFRMRPTSTPLPRITPQDRAVSLAGIDGIPPGTRVNTFQWFIHRNPDNYSRVNEWYPERFLDDEPKDGKTPLLWAFGGGSRMCVGVSLTQYRKCALWRARFYFSCYVQLTSIYSHAIHIGVTLLQFHVKGHFQKGRPPRAGVCGG